MKKIITTLLMLTLVLTGCSNDKSNDKLSIVTTIYPTYDWVNEIVGDNTNYEITLLGDNGIDLHSYQATSEDLIKVSEADIFIYVGGPSDEWVDDALKNSTNEDLVSINLIDVLGDKVVNDEIIEGMTEENHDHDHEETTEEDHEREHEEEEHNHTDEEHNHADEHIWLSLKNVKTIISFLEEEISKKDEKNVKSYEENASQYLSELDNLDKEYQTIVDNSSKNTLLFADRFAFRYLIEDYNLNYYAAFSGCSAETEASFETIKYLSDKVNTENINTLLVIEGRTHEIPETIISTANKNNVEILSLNSMQSITSEEIENSSYLTIMEENLKVIEKALGE